MKAIRFQGIVEPLLFPEPPAGTPSSGRDKVSNLLNIADGRPGDHMKLQIVATTNVPISRFDRAVVHRGWQVGAREFCRLTREAARQLDEAKGLVLPDGEEVSLAELCCCPTKVSFLAKEREMRYA